MEVKLGEGEVGGGEVKIGATRGLGGGISSFSRIGRVIVKEVREFPPGCSLTLPVAGQELFKISQKLCPHVDTEPH